MAGALHSGYERVPGWLSETWRSSVLSEFDSVSIDTLPSNGMVRQEGRIQRIAPLCAGGPHLNEVARALRRAALGSQIADIADFSPNEAVLQHYDRPSHGISAHRDSVKYLGLICVISLVGHAAFDLLQDRCGPVVQRWMLRPGDLVLLRGTLTKGRGEVRPFHRVGGPESGSRVSLALRMQGSEVSLSSSVRDH